MKEEKEEFHVSFYDSDDNEIGRKTYKGSYGGMIYQAKRRANRIGAVYFWHKHYLRKFEMHDV